MSKLRNLFACVSGAVLLTAATVSFTASASNFPNGDVNRDGIVNKADISALKQIIELGNSSVPAWRRTSVSLKANSPKLRAADVNGDGYVNDADIHALESRLSSSKRVIVGDIDEDGNITYKDLDLLNNIILVPDNYTDAQRKAADINRDNSVTIADLVTMENANIFLNGQDFECSPGAHFLSNSNYIGFLQEDGNFVITNTNNQEIIFSTNTAYGDDFKDYKMRFRSDGNLMLLGTPNYSGGRERVIWNSGTGMQSNTAFYRLTFSESGNLVLRLGNDILWTSAKKCDPRPLTTEEHIAIANERIGVLEGNYMYSDHAKAAIDFAYYYAPISYRENTEYGTAINKVYDSSGNEKYMLDLKPFPDEPNNGLSGEPRGNSYDGAGHPLNLDKNPAAYVHTHGKHLCLENEWFSIGPHNEYERAVYENADEDNTFDTTIAYRNNITAYLGSPDGHVLVFVPFQDEIPEHKPDIVAAMQNTGRIIHSGIPTGYPN